MNWDHARRILAWDGRRAAAVPAGPLRRPAPGPGTHARSLCIASGKGGTGKSVVTASLAAVLAETRRVLVIDADLGVGNAHILQDVAPEHSLVDLVEGRAGPRDVVAHCGQNLDLLAAGSGVSHVASLEPWEMSLVAGAVSEIEREYDWVLVDSGAGISTQTVALAAACDRVLLVTTPDVTALTDAYAFLKVLLQRDPRAAPCFVVNRATSEAEATQVAERLRGAAHKFLARDVRCLGWLPDDRAVVRCVNARAPVVRREPTAPFAAGLRELAAVVERDFAAGPSLGLGARLGRSVGPA
ncbi:MAG: AAA family ATPase [Planctomycetota bacterium]|nr:AAA family ATPase [Planctomycetota bacterium]